MKPELGEPEVRGLALGQRSNIAPADQDAPAVGSSSIATISSSVVLPDPLGPYSATVSPACDGQRNAVHRAHGLPADGAVVLDEVTQLEHSIPRSPGRAARHAGLAGHSRQTGVSPNTAADVHGDGVMSIPRSCR